MLVFGSGRRGFEVRREEPSKSHHIVWSWQWQKLCTESKLTLFPGSQASKSQMRCRDFIWEPADWEDGRLVPQITVLSGPECQVLLWIRDGSGEWGIKVKKTIYFLQMLLEWQTSGRGMLVSLPYSHFMGRVKLNISCQINKQSCHLYLWLRPP